MSGDSSAYVRHKARPAWGVGVLVSETTDTRTYAFSDGQTRSIKATACETFLEPAEPPTREVEARLSRGRASGGAATPKAVNLELEARIRASPDDPQPYLVYADWLIERGDPRGELITTHQAVRADPASKRLRDAERALLEKHGEYLLPAKLHAMVARAPRAADDPSTRCEARWRLGFLERVRLAKRPRQEADLAAMAADVLRHPSAVFLVGLTIGPLGTPDTFAYNAIAQSIANATHATLRDLTLGDFDSRHIDLAFSRAGDVSPLFAALPALERLTLRAGSMRFGTNVVHAALKELRVEVAEMPDATLERLLRLSCASLESFELSCANIAAPPGLTRKLLETGAPRLRRLAIRKGAGTNALLQGLLASPALARLASLELTESDLDDTAVPLLLAHATELGHLERLDLSDSRISAAGRTQLETLGPYVVVTPRTPRVEIDDAEVVARAPDAPSMAAARAIAKPEAWLTLARDGDRLWGEFEGSDYYHVLARTAVRETRCSCASPKDPCKHALALLLLAAMRHPFEERPLPEALARQSRERPRYNSVWE